MFLNKGLLGITVTVDSVKAPDADVDGLPLKEEDKAKIRGKYFFFVKQTLTNIDGANLGGIQAPTLMATTKSGGFPGSVLSIGREITVTGCAERAFAPNDFTAKGAVYETCELQFGVPNDPIASLMYTGKPYDSADKSVTWRK